MKNMNRMAFAVMMLSTLAAGAYAQDTRERNYYYEILDPSHEPKPLVEGFAPTRVSETLDRGLTLVPGQKEGTLYLSWRLLQKRCP